MRFENLEVWKKARELSANIYKELNGLKDYGFKDQITRSGLSIPSNIAEGFETGFPEGVHSVPFICKGLLRGVENPDIHRDGYRLCVLGKEKGEAWIAEAYKISAMLTGLIKARRASPHKPDPS